MESKLLDLHILYHIMADCALKNLQCFFFFVHYNYYVYFFASLKRKSNLFFFFIITKNLFISYDYVRIFRKMPFASTGFNVSKMKKWNSNSTRKLKKKERKKNKRKKSWNGNISRFIHFNDKKDWYPQNRREMMKLNANEKREKNKMQQISLY